MVRTWLAFGAIDLKSVRRDSLLLTVILFPWLLLLSLRLSIPPLTAFLAQRGFNLIEYYPLLVCFFLFLNIPMIFGVMTGFLMLDERDDDTLTALRVTPTSLAGLLSYRLLTSFALSTLCILITTPLTGLVQIKSIASLILPATAASLFAPVMALVLVAFARNKLEGFALMKGAGFILLAPIASFFVTGPAQYLFGLLPTFWPLRSFIAALEGKPSLAHGLTGIAFNLALAAILYHRYQAHFGRSQ